MSRMIKHFTTMRLEGKEQKERVPFLESHLRRFYKSEF